MINLNLVRIHKDYFGCKDKKHIINKNYVAPTVVITYENQKSYKLYCDYLITCYQQVEYPIHSLTLAVV